MPPPNANGVWGVAHVLQSERLSTGFITAQLGDYRTRRVSETEAILTHPAGHVGRPPNPTSDGDVCEAIYLSDSWGNRIIGYRDTVGARLLGLLDYGESVTFCSVSQARTFYKKDGGIVSYTTDDNTPTGRTVYSATLPEGAKLVTPWGALTITKDGAVLATTEGASIYLHEKSVDIIGANVNVVGGSITLGSDPTGLVAQPVCIMVSGSPAASTKVKAVP